MSNETRHDSIGIGVEYGADWDFGDAPGWSETDYEGSRWERIGPLTENGRTAILKHFGLQTVAEKLPLDVLVRTSPEMLLSFGEKPAAVAVA